MGVIVVREFGKREEIDPIVLVLRDVRAEVRLKGLIGALRETVGLRVVRGLVLDRKSTRLNSSHSGESRMPSSA